MSRGVCLPNQSAYLCYFFLEAHQRDKMPSASYCGKELNKTADNILIGGIKLKPSLRQTFFF